MQKDINKLTESMEKMKEVQRIQYDYFKHLTTLSTGSILIIVAFLEKVFSEPTGIFLSIISIIALALCLIGSLLALPLPANIIMYIECLNIARIKEDEQMAEKLDKKRADSLTWIGRYDIILQDFYFK
jgi:hypothetical protein